MDLAQALERKLGLKNIAYRYNLTKEQLFHEAIANDRGRVEKARACKEKCREASSGDSKHCHD